MVYETGDRRYQGESPLSRVKVIKELEKDLVEAYVPLSSIFSEDVPVDQKHVLNLSTSIQKEEASGKKNGQITPLALGEVKGFGLLRILDGFHRTDALRRMGKEEALATIKLNCTEADVLDLRILSAVAHKSVNFARTVEWSQQAWNLTPWHEKIKLTKAFDIRFSDRKPRVDISQEEIGKIREWVDDKCRAWGLHGPTLRQYIAIAQNSDPQLVKAIRFSPGGSGGLKVLTVNHMREVSSCLPGNYDLQNIAVEVMLRDELRVTEARKLVVAMSRAETKEEAIRVANNGSWRTNGETHQKRSNAEKSSSGEVVRLREELFLSEDRFARLYLNSLKEEKERIIASQAKEDEMPAIKKVALALPPDLRTIYILMKKYNLNRGELVRALRQPGEIIEERISRIDKLTQSTILAKIDSPKPKANPPTPAVVAATVPIAPKEVRPDSAGSVVRQPKSGVLFEEKKMPEGQAGVTPTTPDAENLRKPEDFKVGDRIKGILNGNEGKIIEIKEEKGVWYVVMRVGHAGSSFISTISINKFDRSYKLDKEEKARFEEKKESIATTQLLRE